MKTIHKMVVAFTALFSILIVNCDAQIKNSKSEVVKVSGNCETCKRKIETASFKKHVSKGVWDMNLKTLVVTYDSTKTTSDAILKNVALNGYDNEKYLAPDAAYSKLDGCCKYERKTSAVPSGTIIPVKTVIVVPDTSKTVVVAVNPLLSVYKSYFELKDALAKDDGLTASTKAKDLFKAIDAVQMDKLRGDQHIVWMKYSKQLSYDAEHIKGVTELEHQREHFISLSKNMFEVMKVIKMDTPVYYDYCPMANDGKGANWLSQQQPISNPYMGKGMPTCGKVQETIK